MLGVKLQALVYDILVARSVPPRLELELGNFITMMKGAGKRGLECRVEAQTRVI